MQFRHGGVKLEVCDRLEQTRLWRGPPSLTTRARAEIAWLGGAGNSAEVRRVVFVLLSLGCCVFSRRGGGGVGKKNFKACRADPVHLSSYVIFSTPTPSPPASASTSDGSDPSRGRRFTIVPRRARFWIGRPPSRQLRPQVSCVGSAQSQLASLYSARGISAPAPVLAHPQLREEGKEEGQHVDRLGQR